MIKKITKWLLNNQVLSVPRMYVGKALVDYYRDKGMTLISIYSKSPKFFDLVRKIKEETEMRLSGLDAYHIYTIVKKTEKIEGHIAEVGVYKGGSAKLIRAATKKPIHLFDTFEGLPDLSKYDSADKFYKGKYFASFESVKSYLNKYPNFYFYKGIFPSTARPIKDKRFSFVHLDVDIYESTVNCLKFFYPRMNRGGCIISHDYPDSKGVKKAFDEFFEDKPEIIIEPFGTGQSLIVKV